MPDFRSHPADHRFFGAMALVAAGVIVAGFANTYGRKVLTGTPQLATKLRLPMALAFLSPADLDRKTGRYGRSPGAKAERPRLKANAKARRAGAATGASAKHGSET